MKLEKVIFNKEDRTEFVLSKTEAEKLYQELKSIFAQPSNFSVFIDKPRTYFTPPYSPNPDLVQHKQRERHNFNGSTS